MLRDWAFRCTCGTLIFAIQGILRGSVNQETCASNNDSDDRKSSAEPPVDFASGQQRNGWDHEPDFKEYFGKGEAIGAIPFDCNFRFQLSGCGLRFVAFVSISGRLLRIFVVQLG